MKGLYSGRQILALKTQGKNITRSQTAVQAEKAIIRKYGSLSPEGKYFHVGKGNWNKYSLQNDKKRTGKLAASIEEWRERPHKLDFKGVDTKDGVSGKKPRFSVTSLKPSAKLAGRKNKSQPKLRKDTIISTPKQKVVTELKRGRAKTLKYKIEILRNQGKSWENSGMIVDSKEKADAMIASANSDGFGRKLRAIPVYHITGDGIPYHSYEPVETKITKKPTKPKSEIKANHVYGSFMRPLWIGFNPGVQYREIKVTDANKTCTYT